LVDAGLATAERESFVVKTVRYKVETVAEAETRRLTRNMGRRVTRTRAFPQHGTASGYGKLKCRDDCPEPFTCRMAANQAAREHNQRKRQQKEKVRHAASADLQTV